MGEFVEITARDGHKLNAYHAGPADARRGLIVAQEIFGVNAHIRSRVDLFAQFGVAVIAPSLFDRVERGVDLRYGPNDIARGKEMKEQITEEMVLEDVAACADYLGMAKIGMVGYCWGATVTWQVATKTTLLSMACCWYGAGIATLKDRVPLCPVQMHFGENDRSIPLADVESIRHTHPEVEVNLYYGAEHGFGCEARESFNGDVYEEAQERSIAFYNRFIPREKPASPEPPPVNQPPLVLRRKFF